MHSQGTPGFHTLGCYDKVPFRSCDMDMMFTFLQLLGDHVKVVLFSCSEYEARNYVCCCIAKWSSKSESMKSTGRFLSSVWRSILNWYLDEAAYIQDNRTKVTGGKTICLLGMQKSFLKDASKPVEFASLLTWPEYQKIVRKWYRKLATVRRFN
jgi:THO complex subunit 2